MWRSSVERVESAHVRLALAHALWGWAPRPRRRELFTGPPKSPSLDPLGTVQRVWRDGRRLLGKIALPPDGPPWCGRARGCKGLSCDVLGLVFTNPSCYLRISSSRIAH